MYKLKSNQPTVYKILNVCVLYIQFIIVLISQTEYYR